MTSTVWNPWQVPQRVVHLQSRSGRAGNGKRKERKEAEHNLRPYRRKAAEWSRSTLGNRMKNHAAFVLVSLILAGCRSMPVHVITQRYVTGEMSARRQVYVDDTDKTVNHGLQTLYHRNGQKLCEGPAVHGKSHGEWVHWRPDGTEYSRGTFKHGKMWSGAHLIIGINSLGIDPYELGPAEYRDGKIVTPNNH